MKNVYLGLRSKQEYEDLETENHEVLTRNCNIKFGTKIKLLKQEKSW